LPDWYSEWYKSRHKQNERHKEKREVRSTLSAPHRIPLGPLPPAKSLDAGRAAEPRLYDNSLQQPRLIAFGKGPQTRSVNDADSWRRILAEG
jgi:hypothetical protein